MLLALVNAVLIGRCGRGLKALAVDGVKLDTSLMRCPGQADAIQEMTYAKERIVLFPPVEGAVLTLLANNRHN